MSAASRLASSRAGLSPPCPCGRLSSRPDKVSRLNAAMADAGTQGTAIGANAPRSIDTVMLGSMLNRARAQAAADPFSNPILLFALDLTLRIDRGEINLDGLESLVQWLTAEAFADRAERLSNYLGEN